MGRSVRRLSVERLESRDLLCSFESLIDLNCLFPENGGDGSQGVALLAPESGRRGNFESAGDFNGDGFFDFVLVNTDQPAPAYLFLGGQDRPALLNLDTSPLESVATFEGALRYVSAADFNGDGLTDLLTGSPGDSTEGSLTGQARIWFGHSDLRSEYLNSELDGRNGVVIQGDRDLTFLGDWHSEIGDFNGDGLDDFAVSGTFGRTPEGLDLVGYVAVVYGSDDELPSPMHPFQHFDGSLGSGIFGEDDNDQFGRVVLPVGDINGDRYDDFYVRSSTEAKSGVFFGSEAGIGFNISDFPEFGVHSLDGTNGFSGSSIRVNVGDFNGDGIEDTVGNSVDGGVVRLGGITTFPPQLPQLTPQDGVSFPTSSSLSPLGDIDGDGFDDLRVYYQEDSYDSRLAFGGPYQSSTTFDRARALPFSFLEQGYLGGVRSVGDINGDGFDDMLLRYWSDRVWTPSDPNLPFGFLVYGQDFRGVVTHAGTEGDDVLEGTSADDVLIGGLGDDTIRGGGGADSLRGAAGNDKLSVADVDFRRVDGGTGVDTLVWEVPHGELNLISIGTQRLKSIEKIDLRSAKREYSEHSIVWLCCRLRKPPLICMCGWTNRTRFGYWTIGLTSARRRRDDGPGSPYRAGQARLFVSTRPPLVDAIPNRSRRRGIHLGPIAIHVQRSV
ncbi:MAG: FG-GAP-like repeat-containing protein [Pirellulaceae bacterium]